MAFLRKEKWRREERRGGREEGRGVGREKKESPNKFLMELVNFHGINTHNLLP